MHEIVSNSLFSNQAFKKIVLMAMNFMLGKTKYYNVSFVLCGHLYTPYC